MYSDLHWSLALLLPGLPTAWRPKCQNVSAEKIRKANIRLYSRFHLYILSFLISFFLIYFYCLYICSIYVFELCEMWSFHISFYVVSRLLGCEPIYAAIKLWAFLSCVTFTRETEQCSEKPVNYCQMTLASAVFICTLLKDAVSSSDYVVSVA
jgi:hypothetical protein